MTARSARGLQALDAPADPRELVSLRRRFVLVGATVFAIAVALFCTVIGPSLRGTHPYDFNVNLVAAQRLVDADALYDGAASRLEAIRMLGDGEATANFSNTATFNRFVGSPATALLHTPLLPFTPASAAILFQLTALVGMVTSVVITARALPRESRLPGALIGVGVLLLANPLENALALGQGHQFVMLGLAAGVWGVARERWGVAGVGLGVATVLKLSPGLILVYLLLRGRRQPAGWAAGTIAGLLATSAAVGRPNDLVVWVRDITPKLSQSSLHYWNQSLGAWLTRMYSQADPITANLRGWSVISPLLALLVVFGLWWLRRGHAILPAELGIIVLGALIAGPLTWDHYTVWAVVPLVLCLDLPCWVRRGHTERSLLAGCLGGAALLLTVPLEAVWSHDADPPWSGLSTSPRTVALLLLFGVALRLTLSPRDAPGSQRGEFAPIAGRESGGGERPLARVRA